MIRGPKIIHITYRQSQYYLQREKKYLSFKSFRDYVFLERIVCMHTLSCEIPNQCLGVCGATCHAWKGKEGTAHTWQVRRGGADKMAQFFIRMYINFVLYRLCIYYIDKVCIQHTYVCKVCIHICTKFICVYIFFIRKNVCVYIKFIYICMYKHTTYIKFVHMYVKYV